MSTTQTNQNPVKKYQNNPKKNFASFIFHFTLLSMLMKAPWAQIDLSKYCHVTLGRAKQKMEEDGVSF